MTRRPNARLVLAVAWIFALTGCAGQSGGKGPQASNPPPRAPVLVDTTTTFPPTVGARSDSPDDAVGEPVNGGGKRETSSRPRPATNLPDTASADVHELPVIERAMTQEERKLALQRVIVDTTAAGAAIRRCAARTLLPDQESVYDTATSLLAQTTAALKGDELWRAESLARKARQLASSLACP